MFFPSKHYVTPSRSNLRSNLIITGFYSTVSQVFSFECLFCVSPLIKYRPVSCEDYTGYIIDWIMDIQGILCESEPENSPPNSVCLNLTNSVSAVLIRV